MDEAKRKWLTDQIPPWYRWWVHLGATTLLGLATASIALWEVSHLHWADLFTVAFAVLASNGIEWFFHKELMHRRVPWIPGAYEGHTSEHHVAFTDQDMPIRELRELKLVMLPFLTLAMAYGVLLGIGVFFGLLRTNVGALWVATGALYLVMYEWLHTLYHLPFIGPVIARVRDHHRTHHDPKMMNWWNFNVSFPVWDRVMGTFYRKDN